MKTFEQALREQIESSGTRRVRARRLLKVLNARPSARRTRVLARLERQAARFLEDEGVAAGRAGIDWGAIDWAALFDRLLKFLLSILDVFA